MDAGMKVRLLKKLREQQRQRVTADGSGLSLAAETSSQALFQLSNPCKEKKAHHFLQILVIANSFCLPWECSISV